MTKSWDSFASFTKQVDADFGAGAYNAFREHLRKQGKTFDDVAYMPFSSAVVGADDDEGTLKYHRSVINSDEGRAFLNSFAGRPLDSTTGFQNNYSQFVSAPTEKRGSIFSPVAPVKRRKSIFSGSNSLFGN